MGSTSAPHINSYDVFGIPDAGNLGRFSYTGQIWLPEIGLMYYKARIYNPQLGRFMQTDPIGYDDQMNMYAYVGNDPMNAVDPSGMQEWFGGSKDDEDSPSAERDAKSNYRILSAASGAMNPWTDSINSTDAARIDAAEDAFIEAAKQIPCSPALLNAMTVRPFTSYLGDNTITTSASVEAVLGGGVMVDGGYYYHGQSGTYGIALAIGFGGGISIGVGGGMAVTEGIPTQGEVSAYSQTSVSIYGVSGTVTLSPKDRAPPSGAGLSKSFSPNIKPKLGVGGYSGVMWSSVYECGRLN